MRGTDVLKHEYPLGECGGATNAAELRMPVGRMFFERMPAANV
jgi:hypothetical protein